jgi:hypothetical protein
MGMRPSRRATLRPAQTCGPEPKARCRLGWRPTSRPIGSANSPGAVGGADARLKVPPVWHPADLGRCRADVIAELIGAFEAQDFLQPRRGSGGSRASVMIEKFAGVRGMVRSEFLDLSHTGITFGSGVPYDTTFARPLAARCGDLRNRYTSDGCRVHRPFSRIQAPEWRASAPSRIRQIGKAHCQSTVGADIVMGASVGLARPNQILVLRGALGFARHPGGRKSMPGAISVDHRRGGVRPASYHPARAGRAGSRGA